MRERTIVSARMVTVPKGDHMTDASSLLALADAEYVSLTTYRKSGEGVPTAVWAARDGDSLVIRTADGSGKIKRIRSNPRVTLAPCTASGKVAPDAPHAEGIASIEAFTPEIDALFAQKYKLMYKLIGLRRRGRSDTVVVRVAPPDAD